MGAWSAVGGSPRDTQCSRLTSSVHDSLQVSHSFFFPLGGGGKICSFLVVVVVVVVTLIPSCVHAFDVHDSLPVSQGGLGTRYVLFMFVCCAHA